MPWSLRLILLLIAFGVALAAASLAVQRRETKGHDRDLAVALTGGDPQRGKQAMLRYGCGACHTIPGVPRADGETAPSLAKIAGRGFLAGHLANQPQWMIAWVRSPQSIQPGVGMPDMGVTEKDGRDIAAYLYTLR